MNMIRAFRRSIERAKSLPISRTRMSGDGANRRKFRMRRPAHRRMKIHEKSLANKTRPAE